MGRSSTPSFIVTRRLYVEPYQASFIDRKMDVCNRLYNIAVNYCFKQLELLNKDIWYREALKHFRASTDEKASKAWAEEIGACIEAYDLTEYAIHKFFGNIKRQAFEDGIDINVVQKVGSQLYVAVRKAIFSNTKIHYRKYGKTDSFETKKATSAIIYKKETDTVKVFGKVLKLKPIRKTDYYLQEAMTHKIKYCKIVRKPFRNGYKYFLQFVMEGEPPRKLTLGEGPCGFDGGTSTVAYYNDKEAGFVVLGDGVEKYEKTIKEAAVKYERRLRLANPDCYNEDGTLKKGCKLKKYTKGSKKALMELKAAYRLKTEFLTQSHNRFANNLVRQSGFLIKEPMDYRKLAKRAKVTSVEQTPKDKPKRVKRFGKSIGKRAPGLLQKTLVQKFERYGGYVIDVSIRKYKASQYNHITQTATRPKLSDRVKVIGDYLVQRDLYSSFLLYNYKDTENIDFDKCNKLFKDFLNKQNEVIDTIKIKGDKTKNFGLTAFDSNKVR